MNAFQLGRCLGDVKPTAFKRFYLRHQLESLNHDTHIVFDYQASPHGQDHLRDGHPSQSPIVAHKAGTNCIAIDQTTGRYLISAGADTSIRLWDLEYSPDRTTPSQSAQTIRPISSISRSTRGSHLNALTSLSIYPFDPIPTSILSTSYDSTFLLTSMTPTSIVPFHKFPLDFQAHCHAISPLPSAQPLVAIGTTHPAPRLIDLRSSLATHALPGLSGSVYSMAWHPSKEHILLASSTAGQILAFDIRRATPAFASFDADNTLGILNPSASVQQTAMSYTHRAHSAPITGIVFSRDGSKLISASHDQRIRVWDVATGRNDLVHFGPRIRNSREGELRPVLAPVGTAGLKAGRECLVWPNDDGRGELFMHELREGVLVKVLETRGVVREVVGRGKSVRRGSSATVIARASISASASVGRLTSGGRISAVAFRPVNSTEGLGGSLEMYTGHGDGRICAWLARDGGEEPSEDEEVRENNRGDVDGEYPHSDSESVDVQRKTQEEIDAERSRKRKRALIEGLVEGLTKKHIAFS